jgi:ligand-binding sensor domain-containing protein
MNWTHHEQPESTFALAALGSMYLAATEQGLWRWSAKKGWQPTAPQFAQVAISAIAIAGKTILIGSADGVARSLDNGETWTLVNMPVKAQVLALALSPCFERDGIAWAATAQDGVLRSPDHGATWHAWNFGLLDLSVNAMAVSSTFAEDEMAYAATEHGVFISENQGRAWREFGFPNDAGPVTALAVGNRPIANSQLPIYAATEGNGLWCFDGVAWERVKSLKAENVNGLISTNNELVAATTDGVYSSKDVKKWQKRSDVDDGVCLLSLGEQSPQLIVGTAGGGMWHAEH